MPQQFWYKEWFSSPFYQRLYAQQDVQASVAFLNKLLEHLRPPAGSRVLDAACGRGDNSRMLAKAGFHVTGIDGTPKNIVHALQFQEEHLDFYEHDIRLPFWGNYFNLALIMSGNFGHYHTRREHDDAIRTISKSLKPGGKIVIDYPNVHYKEEHRVNNETISIGDTNFDIHRWDDEQYFYKKISIIDPSLQVPETHTEKYSKFTLGDFTDMLSFQGLQVQEVYGDYELQSYHINRTPRLIIIAGKRELEKMDGEKRVYSDGRSTDALT